MKPVYRDSKGRFSKKGRPRARLSGFRGAEGIKPASINIEPVSYRQKGNKPPILRYRNADTNAFIPNELAQAIINSDEYKERQKREFENEQEKALNKSDTVISIVPFYDLLREFDDFVAFFDFNFAAVDMSLASASGWFRTFKLSRARMALLKLVYEAAKTADKTKDSGQQFMLALDDSTGQSNYYIQDE